MHYTLFRILPLLLALPALHAADKSSNAFDPSKSLKDYAGKTIIGSKLRNCVSDKANLMRNVELVKKHCTGIQPLHYPAFNGSWPDKEPKSPADITFSSERLDVLVNWAVRNKQQTLHHLMVASNNYYPKWFWTTKYTAKDLDQVLKKQITTLMNANDNKTKMAGWNIFNEMFVHSGKLGRYKKDGTGRQDCIWMRMGFEDDRSGLKGKAKVNAKHPIVFRKALGYASIAKGKLEIRDNEVAEINRKSDALYQLIKHLKNTGVRVDAVGFQCHMMVGRRYNWDSIRRNFIRFKKLGVEVHITELDVGLRGGKTHSGKFPKDYEKDQAKIYYGIIKAAREADIERIDFWGICDGLGDSWRKGHKARIFDENFKRRPTYQAVLRALYDTQK